MVCPELTEQIRREVAASLHQRKGDFTCYFLTDLVTFTLPAGQSAFYPPYLVVFFPPLMAALFLYNETTCMYVSIFSIFFLFLRISRETPQKFACAPA